MGLYSTFLNVLQDYGNVGIYYYFKYGISCLLGYDNEYVCECRFNFNNVPHLYFRIRTN